MIDKPKGLSLHDHDFYTTTTYTTTTTTRPRLHSHDERHHRLPYSAITDACSDEPFGSSIVP